MNDTFGALVAGSVAMATGRNDFALQDENEKVWRFSKHGNPCLTITKNREKLTMWVRSDSRAALLTKITLERRTFGATRAGASAVGRNPGMHSNLAPFMGTNELTCFVPDSLDEAWEILEAL